jgi:putative Holliday junction resolvase
VRIGVDVGNARVGVAASDPSGTFAHPVQTLARDAKGSTDLDAIADLVVERDALEVVVGLPRHLSGEEGEAARIARSSASGSSTSG